jgi:hypothetical protein
MSSALSLLDQFNSIYSKIRSHGWKEEQILEEWQKFHNEKPRVDHLNGLEVYASTFNEALKELWKKFCAHMHGFLYLANFLTALQPAVKNFQRNSPLAPKN